MSGTDLLIVAVAASVALLGGMVWGVRLSRPQKKGAEARKKRRERSAVFCLMCFALGVINVAIYWLAVFLGKAPGETVACTGMVEMIAPVIAYYIYQAKLKDSRNKYKVDENGVPYDVGGTT